MALPLLIPLGVVGSIFSIPFAFAIFGDVIGLGIAILVVIGVFCTISRALDKLDIPRGDIPGDQQWY